MHDVQHRDAQETSIGLRETAVLASSLEHLVHDEAVERLNKAYELQSLRQHDHLDQPQSENVFDACMKLYIMLRCRR